MTLRTGTQPKRLHIHLKEAKTVSIDRNPQLEQMAHESMIRTLAAQASAIWPQEELLFERYLLPSDARILDVGCGTGEVTIRLHARYPQAQLLGVDILEGPLAHARARETADSRIEFQRGDAFDLAFAANHFDLVVCRHLTQAVPQPELIVAELHRVCKPGGWVHVLSEDYGMLHFPHGSVDIDRLWRDGVGALAQKMRTDERVGRRTWTLLNRLRLEELRVDYVIVDTLRVPRVVFANILSAWRDGYLRAIEEHGRLPKGEARTLFESAIRAVESDDEYAVWHLPVVSGRKGMSQQDRKGR